MSERPTHPRPLVEILAILVVVACVFEAIRRSDRDIVESYNPQRFTTPVLGQHQPTVTDDERRVAETFEADTLPRLIHHGLIHRVVMGEWGTVVTVAGDLWEPRSRFFKESLLKAVVVYDKVQGHLLSTRIIDARTGKLYAQGSDLDGVTIFD